MSTTGTVFINFGAAATTSHYPIGPGELFTFPPGMSSDQEIYVISVGGGEVLRVLEWA